MKSIIAAVGISCVASLGLAGLAGATPKDDKDWAFEQSLGDGELKSEFNPAFGTHAVVTFDRTLRHWTSLQNMYESCQGTGPGSMALQTVGQIVRWGNKFKSIHDGLAAIQTITVKDGREDKVTITKTNIDIVFDECSLYSFSHEQSAQALMAAFPEALFEEAEQEGKPHVLAFGDKCASDAKLVLDRKLDDKALRDAYGIGMKSVCMNALDYAAVACTQNPKIKEAFSKLKTFTCTDTGKGPEWAFKWAGGDFTEIVSNKPLSHRVFNLFVEKQVPGAKAAWTIERGMVEAE